MGNRAHEKILVEFPKICNLEVFSLIKINFKSVSTKIPKFAKSVQKFIQFDNSTTHSRIFNVDTYFRDYSTYNT